LKRIIIHLSIVPIALLISGSLFSQLSDYKLTASSASFSLNTGSASAVNSIETDDALSNAIAIGFTFRFDTTNYTHVKASSNGWLTFDTTRNPSALINRTNGLKSNTGVRTSIAPLWDNLDGTLGDASHELSGVAPNRIFTFEWKNWKWDKNASSPVISFQVKLYETSNKIEFIYRQETGTLVTNSGGASIGFAVKDTGAGNFLSILNTSASPTFSITSESLNISSRPATGQVYSLMKDVWDLELDSFISPIGVCSDSFATITVAIKNNSLKAINFSSDSCVVSVKTSGVSSLNFSKTIKTGSLSANDTMHVLLSSGYNKAIIGSHNFFGQVLIKDDPVKSNDTLMMQLVIDTATKASLPAFSNLCLNAAPLKIMGVGLPKGGTKVYSGSGVSSNSFNPISAGHGSHLVKMVYTDLHNCKDSVSASILVDTLPKVSLGSFSSICLGDSALILKTGSPMGGYYFGKNVGINLFVPFSSGVDTIYYRYNDANNCTDTAIQTIVVDTLPAITISKMPNICVNSPTIILSGGSPLGGVYSGNNVAGGKYTPSTLKDDTIHYSFTDLNKCSATAFTILQIDSTPVVSLNLGFSQLCENAGKKALTGGVPSGGTYKGVHVLGGDFDPSLQTANSSVVHYVYVLGNGCKDSSQSTVQIDSIQKVTLTSFGAICKMSSPVALNAGMPLGGVYKGPFVASSRSEFNPANSPLGGNPINYVFTTPKGCKDSSQGNILVEPNPSFELGNDTAICGSAQLTLDPGLPLMKYSWSTGDSSRTITIQESAIIIAEIKDTSTSSNCTFRDTIRIDYDEICVGIQEDFAGASIRYFPNPNDGQFSLEIKNVNMDRLKIQIISMTGAKIYERELEIQNGTYLGEIKLEDLPSGIYIMNLKSEIGIVSGRINIR